MDERIFFEQTESVNNIISIVELFFTIIYTYYTYKKFAGIKDYSLKNKIVNILLSIIIAIFGQVIRVKLDLYHSDVFIIIIIILTNNIIYKKNPIYSTSMSIISYCTNYAIYLLSGIIAFIPNVIFKIRSDYIGAVIIVSIYSFLIIIILKRKKVKYGIAYLQEKMKNSYISLTIINMCILILFLKTIWIDTEIYHDRKPFLSTILFIIWMLFFIKQSFSLYYKHKLLEKELEQTKSELEAQKQEVEKLEKENLEFSKTSHSLAHKQKALEYKLEQLMKTGIDIKSKEAIKREIENISKEVYKEPELIELSKTGIESIDNIFSYMQSECIKDNIKFELQVTGNIFHMINNLISENDLEVLIADHIKDAIIAINNSDNENRSILIRIGKIDGIDSLYIYDSGIEFEKEVLDNLGKKPITTHADSGGTGMGFMNTFDTLNKTKASLTINEIGKPCIDNYTKVLMFKFDGQNEFKVDSYKNEVAVV